MRKENERITRVLEHIQKEQVQHNTELLAFVEEVSAIRERLVKARVLSRVAPIFRQLAIEKRIPNPFYPQVYEEAVKQPLRTPTPRPPTPGPSLRPTNPELPTAASLPLTEVYSPPPAPIPPRMDYSAGNPRGPHHQPTMFEEEAGCYAPRVILVPCVHLCLPLLHSYLICTTGLLVAVYRTHFGLSR